MSSIRQRGNFKTFKGQQHRRLVHKFNQCLSASLQYHAFSHHRPPTTYRHQSVFADRRKLGEDRRATVTVVMGMTDPLGGRASTETRGSDAQLDTKRTVTERRAG